VTRTLLPSQKKERESRREMLDKNEMAKYSEIISKKEAMKEELTKEFSALAFKMVKISPEKYYESMLKISHNDIMFAQEEAVLHATVNWAEHTKICCERSDEGIRPVSKERVRMAEVNMQGKIRDLQIKTE
jgi:hypothetical protein